MRSRSYSAKASIIRRAWVRARGAELVAVHEDLGISGGAELEKRPGLLAALDALREHGAGVLLVAKRDRLARDPMVAAMVERLAECAGGAVVSAAGEGNGDSPADVLERVTLGDRPEALIFGAAARVSHDPARVAAPARLGLAHGLLLTPIVLVSPDRSQAKRGGRAPPSEARFLEIEQERRHSVVVACRRSR